MRSRSGLLVIALAVTAVLSSCSSTSDRSAESTTEASTTSPVPSPTPDPCGLADHAEVDRLAGAPTVVATSTSEMSGDGSGLVLNCVFAVDGDVSTAIGFVQRLGFGRTAFDASRDATADAEPLASGAYWVPSKRQALALDGDDLVAVRFLGIDATAETAETAETTLAAAIARRR